MEQSGAGLSLTEYYVFDQLTLCCVLREGDEVKEKVKTND